MMRPLRLSLLSLFALSCSSAVSQSVRYDATGGALFFSPAPDSSSCSLSRVEFKSAASVSLCVPEFVHNGNRKLSVSSLGGGDEPLCRQVQALRDVSIPRSVKNVESLSFSVCPNLSKVTSYAPYPPALGRGAFLKGRYLGEVDTLVVPASAVERYKSSSWGKSFSTFLPLYTFTYDRRPSDGVSVASVASSTSFADLFFAYTDGMSGLSVRTPVTLARAISFPVFSPGSADFKSLSSRLPAIPTVESLAASFRGQAVSNLSARLDGVFGSVKVGGSVENLVFDGAFLLVDPENDTFERSDGRTLYVHVLAGRNHGRLQTVGFAGSVVISSAAKVYGVDKIVVTLVGRQGRTGSVNGFLFLKDVVGPSRSLTTLTDCRGVGIDESLASKVAVRGAPKSDRVKKPGVDSFNPDDDRFRYTTCAFSDEEFASGLVAYWLNFKGVGFSGDYAPSWRQGLEHPEAEASPSKALYKVDYQIDGESFLSSAPEFANGGDRVTLTYSRRPVSLTVGGQKVDAPDGAASFTYRAGDVVAISWTRADFKPAEVPKEPGVQVNVKGSLISVSGAGKQLKGLYTITGIKICETTGSSLSAPRSGAYTVKIGKRSWRVLVK